MNSVQRASWKQKRSLKKRARLTANKKENNTLRPIRRAEHRQKIAELRAAMMTAIKDASITPATPVETLAEVPTEISTAAEVVETQPNS